MRAWRRLRGILAPPQTSNEFIGASRSKQGLVEVQLTESFSAIEDGQPTMRHSRCFSNASSEQVLGLLLGVKFYGKGGLMVDSTADSEEDSPDGHSRFIKNFRPLGDSFGSVLAGSFDVREELIECSAGPHGVMATIRMSFSPAKPNDQYPSGSFLWRIEPEGANENETRACWTELINTSQTRGAQIPGLRIKPGARRVFQLGHNRLIQKAAQRIAGILNSGDHSGVNFASYAQAARTNFLPGKCRGQIRKSE